MKNISILISVLFTAFSISLIGAEKRRILVDEVEPIKTEKSIAHALEEMIVLEIGNRSEYRVLGSREINQIANYIKEGEKIDCRDSMECQVKLRDKLNSEIMISSSIATLPDGTLVFSMNSINLSTSSVGQRENLMGKSLNELKDIIPAAIDRILGVSKKEASFSLPEGQNLKLAVMPLEAKGVDEVTSNSLTQILNGELNQIEGISVISQNDIQAMLKKTDLDLKLSCTNSLECLIEVGASFGAGTLVTGTVGKVDSVYIISLTLIDTRKAEVLNRVLETFVGDEKELTNAVKLCAFQIAGINYDKKMLGEADFTFNAEKAEIILGDIKDNLDKGKYSKKEILPGRYTLKVFADPEDFYPFQTDVYIVPYEKNVRNFKLIEKPTPWYKTWWFYAAAGTVIAATTITTVYLATKNEPPGEGTWPGN